MVNKINNINSRKAEKGDNKMSKFTETVKNINFNVKISTVLLVVVSIAIGFYAGMQFISYQNETVNSKVTELVKQLK